MGKVPSAVAKTIMGHTPESKVYDSTYVNPDIEEELDAVALLPTFGAATKRAEEAEAAK